MLSGGLLIAALVMAGIARKTYLDSCDAFGGGDAASQTSAIVLSVPIAAQFVPITLSFV